MKPVEIKIELLKANVTQAEISRRLNVTPSVVHRVIEGTSVARTVREELAVAIGRPVSVVFPEVAENCGHRRPGRPPANKKAVK